MTLTIERTNDANAARARRSTRGDQRRGLLARLRTTLLGEDYARLKAEEKKAREEAEFLTRERDALIEAARRGGLI